MTPRVSPDTELEGWRDSPGPQGPPSLRRTMHDLSTSQGGLGECGSMRMSWLNIGMKIPARKTRSPSRECKSHLLRELEWFHLAMKELVSRTLKTHPASLGCNFSCRVEVLTTVCNQSSLRTVFEGNRSSVQLKTNTSKVSQRVYLHPWVLRKSTLKWKSETFRSWSGPTSRWPSILGSQGRP